MEHYNISLANWTQGVSENSLQRILKFKDKKSFISFALGLPDSSQFPSAALCEAASYVLCNEENSLQYAPPLVALKMHIKKIMNLRGVNCELSDIFLTTGAQQGITLLSKLLLNNNDTVLLEKLCYPGFTQAIAPFQPTIKTVNYSTKQEIDLVDLERKLSAGLHFRFFYIVADGNNPTGVSLNCDQRKKLIELSKQYAFSIIEDDPYGAIYYDVPTLKPLKHYAPDHVMYIGTLSKILGPSLRIGWLVIPKQYQYMLGVIKEAADLNITTLSQRIAARLLENFDYQAHVAHLSSCYRTKRDYMLERLHQDFTGDINCCTPNNGIFLWVEFKENIDTQQLLDIALQDYGLAFINGQSFSVTDDEIGKSSIRLNFTYPSLAEIDEGIHRLKKAWITLREIIGQRASVLVEAVKIK